MRGKKAGLACAIILLFGLMGLTACNSGGGSPSTLEADVTGTTSPGADDATDGVASSPTEADPNQDGTDTTGDSDVADSDGDGITDGQDNCPNLANPSQVDADGNGVGDLCEVDTDGDGIVDVDDNCPSAENPSQADGDGNGVGDACEVDTDGDGIVDVEDNCPNADNPSQADGDGNGVGDACEVDTDGDGVIDFADNCPAEINQDQADSDGDGLGDVCDNCPVDSNLDQADRDQDTTGDICDLSPLADSFNWLGNTPMNMPASAILDNDPDGTVVDGGDAFSSQGGTVVFDGDGNFTYTPADGFLGQDSFTYTAVNGSHVESAMVTVQIDTLAWYVDNRAPEDLSGSFERPFDSLADAEAASQPGETIFVFAGSGTKAALDSGISLKPDQKLLGEGIAFAFNGIEVVPAGSKPVLRSTVVLDDSPVVSLADGNEVAGLSFEDVVNEAILGQDVNGFDIHDNTFLDPNGEAIRLINVSGSGVVTRNSISGGNQGGIGIVLDGETTVATILATDNLIKDVGTTGISATLMGNSALSLTVKGNIVSGSVLEGIYLGTSGSATLTGDVNENTLVLNGGLADLHATNNDDAAICLELNNNTSDDPVLNPAGCLVDNKSSGVDSFSLFESGNDLPAVRSGEITDVAQGACALP